MNYIISFLKYGLSYWQSTLIGGVIVVGMVIFLVGILKKIALNKIKIKLLRKVILSFLSILLVIPLTFLWDLCKNIGFEYFWIRCAVNSFATIIVYWFYENTGIRNLLELIGQNTIKKLIQAGTNPKNEVIQEIEEDTKKALKYEEEDLKDL